MTDTSTTKRQPSRRARATASLTQAGRLSGEAERAALAEHAAMVWQAKTCALVSRTTRI